MALRIVCLHAFFVGLSTMTAHNTPAPAPHQQANGSATNKLYAHSPTVSICASIATTHAQTHGTHNVPADDASCG